MIDVAVHPVMRCMRRMAELAWDDKRNVRAGSFLFFFIAESVKHRIAAVLLGKKKVVAGNQNVYTMGNNRQ